MSAAAAAAEDFATSASSPEFGTVLCLSLPQWRICKENIAVSWLKQESVLPCFLRLFILSKTNSLACGAFTDPLHCVLRFSVPLQETYKTNWLKRRCLNSCELTEDSNPIVTAFFVQQTSGKACQVCNVTLYVWFEQKLIISRVSQALTRHFKLPVTHDTYCMLKAIQEILVVNPNMLQIRMLCVVFWSTRCLCCFL